MRIATRSLFIFFIGVLFFQCSGKNEQEYYDSGLANIKDGKYDQALTDFETVVKEHPESDLAVKSYFEMGKIFHGKLIKSYSNAKASEQAVEYYSIVANKYPDSPLAPNSLFMVGFIQANELSQFGKARETYTEFLKKYPDNELAKSAQAELDNLGIPAEEILKKNLKEE